MPGIPTSFTSSVSDTTFGANQTPCAGDGCQALIPTAWHEGLPVQSDSQEMYLCRDVSLESSRVLDEELEPSLRHKTGHLEFERTSQVVIFADKGLERVVATVSGRFLLRLIMHYL